MKKHIFWIECIFISVEDCCFSKDGSVHMEAFFPLNLSYSQETTCNRYVGECKRQYVLFYQVDMVKDECGFVHLAQDQQHLIVDELFVLLQVTVHVLLQLCTDLTRQLHSICLFLCSVYYCVVVDVNVYSFCLNPVIVHSWRKSFISVSQKCK